jgi:hypothetical protein
MDLYRRKMSKICAVCLKENMSFSNKMKKVCEQCCTIDVRPCTCCRIDKHVSEFRANKFECRSCGNSKKNNVSNNKIIQSRENKTELFVKCCNKIVPISARVGA